MERTLLILTKLPIYQIVNGVKLFTKLLDELKASCKTVVLPDKVSERFKNIVHKLIELSKDDNLEKTFFFTVLEQQIKNASVETKNAIRWDPRIIHWVTSLKYYGGKKTIALLSGQSSSSMNNDISEKCVYVPTNSTIKKLQVNTSIYHDHLNETIC